MTTPPGLTTTASHTTSSAPHAAAHTGGVRAAAPSPFRPAVGPTSDSIADAVAKLGDGPLDERALVEHVWPLFSRVSNRAEVYLANHSLGRPLDRMAHDVQDALGMWYDDMDGAWSDRDGKGGWLDGIDRYRALVARLIGCPRGDAVVPKTAAGQGVRAVLNAISDRGRVPTVVATRNEFDSTDFILKTYAGKGRADVRWVEPSSEHDGVPLYAKDDVIAALDDSVDLLIVSHVFFNTGRMMPGLGDVAASAHERGALVMIDTYHSAGVLPLSLMADDGERNAQPDFAVGGNYKYTRGGAGACWLAVHPTLLEESATPAISTLDTGWFAKRDTFAYRRPETPVLTAFQALAGLEFTLTVGLDRLRDFNLRQQRGLIEAMRARNLPVVDHADLPGGEPAGAAFTMLRVDDAPAFAQRLREEHHVATDARSGFVRFGPDVLNTEAELVAAADAAAAVLGS
jgi:kynureninase